MRHPSTTFLTARNSRLTKRPPSNRSEVAIVRASALKTRVMLLISGIHSGRDGRPCWNINDSVRSSSRSPPFKTSLDIFGTPRSPSIEPGGQIVLGRRSFSLLSNICHRPSDPLKKSGPHSNPSKVERDLGNEVFYILRLKKSVSI